MVDLYNMTLISNADSMIDQVIIFNYWSQGLLFGGIIVAFAFILFSGAKYAERSTLESVIYTGFFGSLVSIPFWVFRYLGEPAVPTIIPVFFIFLLGGAVVVKLLQGATSQTN